jgi:hypothetical protein
MNSMIPGPYTNHLSPAFLFLSLPFRYSTNPIEYSIIITIIQVILPSLALTINACSGDNIKDSNIPSLDNFSPGWRKNQAGPIINTYLVIIIDAVHDACLEPTLIVQAEAFPLIL